MAANLQQPQGLTAREYLSTALVFLDRAAAELAEAPDRIRKDLSAIRDDVEGYRENLASELIEAIDTEGVECRARNCGYCQRDPGSPWDEASRECNATTPMTCPAVTEILGGVA